MRKAKIQSLARKYRARDPQELYYRSPTDPPGKVRALLDPGQLVSIAQIKKRFALIPEEPLPQRLTFEETASFLNQIGIMDDDDERRITDPEPGAQAIYRDAAGTVRRRSDDGVMCTIPYRRDKVQVYGHMAMMMVPDIRMWRAKPK